jgi:nucleotide-binding universal stress UspA family protein
MSENLTAREANEMVRDPLDIQRILAPTDFSGASEEALAHAAAIAKRFNAKISLLYVCQAQFYANEFAYLPKEESRKSLESFARSRIAPELLGEMLVRNGEAADEIAKAAEELDADLVVINTHGNTGLKHVMLGSTAERVVRYAPCPVLVVREVVRRHV